MTNEGWADNKTVNGRDWFNVHPRYLADVNADGYKDGRADLIGFDQDNVVLQLMPYVTQLQ